jgi:putative transposase
MIETRSPGQSPYARAPSRKLTGRTRFIADNELIRGSLISAFGPSPFQGNMPSADFCLPHPGCCHPGRCRVAHEALSVLWLPNGLISVDSTWRCRVLGYPAEPFPELTRNVNGGRWFKYYLTMEGGRSSIGDMPRQARLDAPGTLHHVMARGIEGTDIFRMDKDREDFLNRLAAQSEAGALRVYAWALIPNHFHLLVLTGNRPLFTSMRKILTGYVVRFNRRHQRQGHLFQNRYKSIVCEEDPYLLELARYIHLNPIRAGMVKTVTELERYPWCGHSVIMGTVKREWQDTEGILRYFGGGRGAVNRYAAFVEEGITRGKREDLGGGGLLRSVGGWSEVVSMRRRGTERASDERILGSGGFVERVISEAEKQERETLRLRRKVPDLSSILGKVARREGLDEEELKRVTRRKAVSAALKLFCQLAVKQYGHTGASVARFLGVTTSLVNRYANSGSAGNSELTVHP